MSGFIAKVPVLPAPSAIADDVMGDGWYPALKISAFLAAMRLGESVSAARAREALLGGFVTAAVALTGWRDAQQLAGVASLAASTIADQAGRMLDGEPLAVILWRRAVYASAAAALAETHGDVSATESGRDRREVRATSADDLRREATVALRDLMGRGRAKVKLV